MASIGNIPWNKGKKNIYSKGTIEKMKNARLGKSAFWNVGKKRTLDNKLKISNSLKGRKLPKEVCDKMSKSKVGKSSYWLLNKKLSEEHKEKLKGRTGSKNPSWKGGKTQVQISIRTCTKNIELIKQILKLDEYTCQNCFNIGGKLEVHHIKKFSIILDEFNIKTINEALDCKELWDINNLITLCISCHKIQQKEKITWIPIGHRCQ